MSKDFYYALEERFRLPDDVVRQRLRAYLPFVRALKVLSPRLHALDLGCGRGEWLQLLTEEGVVGHGVDLDEAMVARCRAGSLRAERRDALAALRAVPDASLELVSAFHVVEHLPFDYLRALLAEAHRALVPGGLLILETPNSENLLVGSSTFYLDPTHQRPVPALLLEFLCQQGGFERSTVLRLNEDPSLRSQQARIGLWQVLYGVSPDYAVVAQKAAADAPADPLAELFAQRTGCDLQGLAARHDGHLVEVEQGIGDLWRSLGQLGQRADADRRLLQSQARRLDDLEASLESARGRHADAEARLQALHASYSWRVTAPLRWLAGLLLQLRPAALAPRVARLLRPAAPEAAPALPPHAGRDLDAEHPPRVLRVRSQLQRLARSGGAVRQPADPPRLAYVSPFPPECSGIADYSAALVPALCAHFGIDVVVEQSRIDAPEVLARCAVRDAAWLRSHAADYDAVLYNFGNSHFHTWMFDLLRQVPGLVVLHDFFLGGLVWSISDQPAHADLKLRELRYGHGHAALAECLRSTDPGQSFFRYPCNRSVLEHAEAVIVHSEEALRLARRWYGDAAGADWVKIPLARAPARDVDRLSARSRLGLPEQGFVVCNFGLIGATKLNHRLLEAWLASSLAQEPDSLLIFVGDAGKSDYAGALLARIEASGLGSRVRVTGWADAATFGDHLAAADLAVQLRAHSRGETSATVLDCMNHGLPTIVNAHGSMAELPEAAVCRLPDEFRDAELVEALERLRHDHAARRELGRRARTVVAGEYGPAHCAALYRAAIEQYVVRRRQRDEALLRKLHGLGTGGVSGEELLGLAEQLAPDEPSPLHQRQLLLDVTETSSTSRRTGIERVARALTLALIESPPAGVRVEPVYLSHEDGRWRYRYANRFAAELLGISSPIGDGRIVDYAAGDALLGLDISGERFVQASRDGIFDRMRSHGVDCRMLVYDLLPVKAPDCFPPGADRSFVEWLDAVARLDGAVCISRTVCAALREWMQAHHAERAGAFRIDSIALGADFASAAPSRGLPHDAEALLARLSAEPTILMVGTLEPRKGYLQALQAFTRLWQAGSRINLVIVGRAGWQDLPVERQRDIPALVDRLQAHRERGRRLFWLDNASDEYLDRLYAAASGLLAASRDEGFGLPLVEAARRGLPILARDIEVFREVAGQQATYFRADSPGGLAQAVADWAERGFAPRPLYCGGQRTWKDSAAALASIVLAAPGQPGAGDASFSRSD